MNNTYDLVVLGGGAAAFAAVAEANRQQKSTALINAGLPLGGTCVNVGCVPSKHLLAVAESASRLQRQPFQGVSYDGTPPSVDWSTIREEKDDLVRQLRKQNYVNVADHYGTDIFTGFGRLVDETTIELTSGAETGKMITGRTILLATGSAPDVPPIDGLNKVPYETSETLLERETLPESLVILGGGFVAMEWGQILHRLGVDVTILQRSDHVLSRMEGQLGRALEQYLTEEGIRILTGTQVQRVQNQPDGVEVQYQHQSELSSFTSEALMVATGVAPNSTNIGLEEVGIAVTGDGAIEVNDYFETAIPHIYAAGDVIGRPMLETVAAKEGNIAMQNAFAGATKSLNYRHVPEVVFTDPEVASVGITEREYMEEHGTCSCRTVEWKDLPKSQAVGDPRGLVQIVRHHETDAIVGVHMIGPRAGDLIGEATLAVQYGLTIDDLINTIHPFPTFSEALKRAAQAFVRDISLMSCCVE